MDTARHLDWSQDDIAAYFSLSPDREVGCYWRKEPFVPHGLSERCPSQLHETKRHKGVYVNLDGLGCPDTKESVIAWLDGVDWTVMNAAKVLVQERYSEQWATFEALCKRTRFVYRKQIAERYSLHRNTVSNHEKTIVDAIDCYLHHLYGKPINEAS